MFTSASSANRLILPRIKPEISRLGDTKELSRFRLGHSGSFGMLL